MKKNIKDKNYINIRSTLKSIAAKNNITFKDWAAKAEIPIGTMNKISCGQSQNPTIGTINALLSCLSLSIKDIDPNYHLEKHNLSTYPSDISEDKRMLLQTLWDNQDNAFDLLKAFDQLSDQGRTCLIQMANELVNYEKAKSQK